MHVENGFVEHLQLAEREFLGKQFETDGTKMDAFAQSRHRHAENALVVESQLGNFVEGKPLCIGCVVAALHFADFDQSQIGHGDHSFARIAVGICKGVELLEIG